MAHCSSPPHKWTSCTKIWNMLWTGLHRREAKSTKQRGATSKKHLSYGTLWGRLTSDCTSQGVQDLQIDSFKALEVPPVWWVNFTHQSGMGGACCVQKAICILICYKLFDSVYVDILRRQIHGTLKSSLIVYKILKHTNEGFKWVVFGFSLSLTTRQTSL